MAAIPSTQPNITFSTVQFSHGVDVVTLTGTLEVNYTTGTVTGSLAASLGGPTVQTFTSFAISAGPNFIVFSTSGLDTLGIEWTGEQPTVITGGFVNLNGVGGFSTLVNGGISSGPVCFVAGTRIAAQGGEIAVENLKSGDRVVTLRSGVAHLQEVRWVGRRTLDLRNHPRPDTVLPIRICASAFADGVPHRDLLVSPEHAIFVDGKLISARQLVNGTTIRQESGWRSVDYYHVELDGHGILLAEGLPAESYLDTGNRGFFTNVSDPVVLHPDLTDETNHPTREAQSCAPFVWNEASVRPIWQALADRAAALGRMAHEQKTATDTALHILVDGRVLKPIATRSGACTFVLPKGTTAICVVSRAATPTETRPWLEDRRRLGVYVERIVVRNGTELRDIPLDQPGLSQGWWGVERDGASLRRWTDGGAMLTLPTFEGSIILEITASRGGMIYPSDTEQARRTA